MSGNLGNDVLKRVSRSFYLSLRLLPGPMREAASLAYLLARMSDTLADTANASLEDRLFCLGEFELALIGEREISRWPLGLLNAVEDVGERNLLEISDDLFAWFGRLPTGEADLVREVVGIIISGQKLDLGRFAGAGRETPVSLEDDAALEDYAWRVAGCVGAFWTKLGFFTMGDSFSSVPASVLIEQGIAYGKGLQLVNILRDLPADLAMGRCYLPVADPLDSNSLLESHGRWLGQSAAWVNAGVAYAESLRSRRLRAATVLPAMIARETLERMRGADWETLQARVKVPRARVYLALMRAFMGKTQ